MSKNPSLKNKKHQQTTGNNLSVADSSNANIAEEINKRINEVKNLKNYPIRDLVKHAESLGEYLAEQNVKTNQLRKFLDAVNRIKAELTREKDISLHTIEIDLQMLKPKLAYSVVRADKRQSLAIKAFGDAMSTAIDHIHEVSSIKDEADEQSFKDGFYRLVQLIEATIAYHKAAGGKTQ